MSNTEIAVSHLRLLASWFSEHAAEDIAQAKSVDRATAGALMVSASAWEAAACKTRELADLLEELDGKDVAELEAMMKEFS